LARGRSRERDAGHGAPATGPRDARAQGGRPPPRVRRRGEPAGLALAGEGARAAARKRPPGQAHRRVLRQPTLPAHGHPRRARPGGDAARARRGDRGLEPGRPRAPGAAGAAPDRARRRRAPRHEREVPDAARQRDDREGVRLGAQPERPAVRRPAGGAEHVAGGAAVDREVPRSPRRAPGHRPRVLDEARRRPRPAHRHVRRGRHQLRVAVPRGPRGAAQAAAQDPGRAPVHARRRHERPQDRARPARAGRDAHGRLRPALDEARHVLARHQARAGAVHRLEAVHEVEERPPADAARRRPAPPAGAAVHPDPV
ncbi:MAG: putative lipoprotein, partial [uncultured Gemmatimonadaceae bacterium]